MTNTHTFAVSTVLICPLTDAQPVLTVLLSEVAVDWLKHAFITKFNHIRPSVYQRYTDVLCRDLGVQVVHHDRSRMPSTSGLDSPATPGLDGTPRRRKASMRKHQYVDQSPVVARRLGFASLPLAILAVLIGTQSVSMIIANYERSSPPQYPSFGSSKVGLSVTEWGWEGLVEWLNEWDWREVVESISRVGPWAVLGLVAWLW